MYIRPSMHGAPGRKKRQPRGLRGQGAGHSGISAHHPSLAALFKAQAGGRGCWRITPLFYSSSSFLPQQLPLTMNVGLASPSPTSAAGPIQEAAVRVLTLLTPRGPLPGACSGHAASGPSQPLPAHQAWDLPERPTPSG